MSTESEHPVSRLQKQRSHRITGASAAGYDFPALDIFAAGV
jgi:hypothetical protein